MEVIVIGGAIGGFYYWTLVRGRKTVRAYLYLGLVRTAKATPAEANAFVNRIGFSEAAETAPEAKAFVHDHFGGKQLSLIHIARAHGFAE